MRRETRPSETKLIRTICALLDKETANGFSGETAALRQFLMPLAIQGHRFKVLPGHPPTIRCDCGGSFPTWPAYGDHLVSEQPSEGEPP